MTQQPAVLVVRTDAPPDRADEWKQWYQSEYLRRRLNLPGFRAARRYEVVKMLPDRFVVPGPTYLAIIELKNLDAVSSKKYRDLVREEESASPGSLDAINADLPNVTGVAYEQIYPEGDAYEIPHDAGFLLALGHAGIPLDVQDEYHDWNNTEHVPSYLEIPGALTARRFRRWKHSDAPGLRLPI